MKKFKLSQFLDTLIIFVLVFAITFIWARYLFNNLIFSLIISLILSLFVVLLRNYLNNKKQKRLKIKKDRELHINDCSEAFLFNNYAENAEFLDKMLNQKYEVEIRNNYLFLQRENNKIALFPLYDNKKITQDQILCCLKSVKHLDLTKIIILCYDYELNVNTIASNYKVKTLVLNKVQVYNDILSVFKCYPETNAHNKIDEKITFSFLIRNAINKKKAKTYFWGGVFLLLASLIIRYNVYYIIFATIMFVLCLISLFSNKIYKTNNTEIL